MRRSVVLLSGGKDSAIALWWAKSRSEVTHALSINYPERPKRERMAAASLSKQAGVPLMEYDLNFLRSVRSSGSNSGSFVTETAYIPMRNLIFFSVAAYVAEEDSADAIVAGQLASDGVAYSDARSEFFAALETVLQMSGLKSFASPGLRIELQLPLINLSDADAVALGISLEAPIGDTWSCLEDGSEPCEACVSCRDRARAIGA